MLVPCRNIIKSYSEETYYHIYNRGINKSSIFLDEQDYSVFLTYLKTYLLPKDEKKLQSMLSDRSLGYVERDKILKLLRLNNFFNEIMLLAYCLISNHFHFLLKQKSINGVDRFMSSLCTRYSMYFNRKYKRVGPIYQSIFKAVAVESDEQLLYLTSYIHRNPLTSSTKKEQLEAVLYSQPSSLPEYLGKRKTEWVHPEEILNCFSKINPFLSYESFVKQTEDLSLIQNQLLDYD